jgi:hypothetical protein
MSEPEIARRCMSCGASVRGRARFCPQCGQSMSEAPTLAQPAVEAPPHAQADTLIGEAERVAHELNEKVSPAAAGGTARADNHTGAPQLSEQAEAGAAAASARAQVGEADEAAPRPDFMTAGDHGAARAALAERAAGMRARAGERVERLREASFIVFDEAHDDPALRFVLVAAALFVLFLLILLLSHILG